MRPLKLTMTAFGPYKDTEVINFNELKQHHLFVISGNTGAGKTTIFDGISYALYGSASGTDREDIKMLRSDFAEDVTHTSVELEFEMKNRIYRIFRQLGHVKQGNKSKTGERYEFFEKVDGREIPRVDRQIVSEIDKKIEEIIGLTQSQFKQIVMLPQGEFRKLLTSQTENKEAILRRLFKTENYKQLNELLKNKKSIAEQDFNYVKQTRDQYVESIWTVLPKREGSFLSRVLSAEQHNVNQIVDGLDEEVAFYLEQISLDQQTYEKAYKAHDKKQSEFHQAKVINDRFQEFDQKKKALKDLHDQVPTYKEKEKKLHAAERASNIELYEKQATDSRKEEEYKVHAFMQAQTAKKQADEHLAEAQALYQKEESNHIKREDISKKLDRQSEYLPTVTAIDERKKQLEELRKKGKETFDELEKVKLALSERNETAEMYNEKIKVVDEKVIQLPDKQIKLSQMEEQAKVLQGFIELKKAQIDLDTECQAKNTVYLNVKTAYYELEEIWINSQASILATHLHDGEACPVCGSLEHPNKTGSSTKMVTKNELDKLKKELDKKDKRYQDASVKQKTNLAQLQKREEELLTYEIPSNDAKHVFDKLVAAGKQLRKEVGQLHKHREELKQLKEFQEKSRTEIKKMEAKKDELEKVFNKQKSDYETSKAVYEERLRNIPKEVRVLAVLEKQICETKDLKVSLEKAWEEAQTLFQKKKEEQTRAEANVMHAEKHMEEAKAKRKKVVKQFTDALHNADFVSEDVYQQAKMSVPNQAKWKEDINRFHQQLSTLHQQVTDLEESLNDKKRVELTELNDELEGLKQAYEVAFRKLSQSKESHQEAAHLKTNIMNAENRLLEREKQLITLSDLYDVMRGQNSKKISFERYLQIEYLEQVIDAANGRLKRLSNGQFYLIRSDRQESHGRQSGLALDVYDSYTGQTRDVKTLSGGEKFNASLCLALGMSDVIQSFQGNAAINTMFIDEGFGSLDEESLNKSIDTLIDLQQTGRMIGVISHVQELKAMFPAILEVQKTKEGYSETKFVVR